MAELLAQFDDPIANNGVTYKAQACGAPGLGNLWQGWIEFIPLDGGRPVRSSRETTQPNREAAAYWASGLTPVYLEGALARALHPVVRTVVAPADPMFEGPAPRLTPAVRSSQRSHEAVLDPYAVAEKSEGLLRQQLSALSARRLINIIDAYDLSEQPIAAVNHLPASDLIDIVVAGVRTRVRAV